MPNNGNRNRAGAAPPPPTSANKIVRGATAAKAASTSGVPTAAPANTGSTPPPPPPPASAFVGIRRRPNLRAFTGMVDKQVTLEEGYGFEGDGGGGFWFFVAADSYSTDNDCTIIVPGGVYGDPATAGAWHRMGPGTKGLSIVPSTTIDVRWAGAIPDQANDVTPGILRAFGALNFAGAQQTGELLFPSGFYAFFTKCVLDMAGQNGNLQLTGSGVSTIFNYAFTAPDTCMMEIKNGSKMGMKGISVEWRNIIATVDSPRVLWIHDFGVAAISDLRGLDLGGNFLALSTISQLCVSNVVTVNRTGTQLAIGLDGPTTGCGGIVTNCSFGTGQGTPAIWVGACNSLKMGDCFAAGGGPWKSFAGATITSTGADFTVNKNAHGFGVGDYIVLTGAAKAGYNARWKIATVPGANSLTVASTANLGADTAVLSTLYSCMLLGGMAGGLCTESSFDHILLNTGGTYAAGSCGVFLDARQANGVKGIQFSKILADYGFTALFMHGTRVGLDTCYGHRLLDVTPNGGPRDDFGAIRIEECHDVNIVGGVMAPGNNAQPGGYTFYSVVVCDGGVAGDTSDITITGLVATSVGQSTLYAGYVFYAFQFDGARVKRVSIVNAGVDVVSGNAHSISLVNGASMANGLTAMYANGAGRMTLEDSTGAHNL